MALSTRQKNPGGLMPPGGWKPDFSCSQKW
jgi:hypothetical protein